MGKSKINEQLKNNILLEVLVQVKYDLLTFFNFYLFIYYWFHCSLFASIDLYCTYKFTMNIYIYIYIYCGVLQEIFTFVCYLLLHFGKPIYISKIFFIYSIKWHLKINKMCHKQSGKVSFYKLRKLSRPVILN